ncbi:MULTISPECIES: hypothetical protein [Streptomyces]|uniref:hypothetical protein n=1 Tax=Streptomyces TaxID=1883 RepID=UPI0033CE6CD9
MSSPSCTRTGRGFSRRPTEVRDTVSPNEVGRICFSLDSEEKRFIVNHVGLHL